MTSLDDKLVPKVRDIVEKFGRLVTLTSHNEDYDPLTGDNPRTPVPVQQKALPRSPYDLSLIDGENIKFGDTQSMIASGGFVPKQGDTVDWPDDTGTWTILAVMPIESGEEICAYEFQVRRT